MQIVSTVDFYLGIKAVRLKGLRWATDKVITTLACTHHDHDGEQEFKAMVLLHDGEDISGNLEFRDPLPLRLIPPFAIDFRCFLDNTTDSLDRVVARVLSNVLSEQASVEFIRKDTRVTMYLTINKWVTSGEVELVEVSKYLLSV